MLTRPMRLKHVVPAHHPHKFLMVFLYIVCAQKWYGAPKIILKQLRGMISILVICSEV